MWNKYCLKYRTYKDSNDIWYNDDDFDISSHSLILQQNKDLKNLKVWSYEYIPSIFMDQYKLLNLFQ